MDELGFEVVLPREEHAEIVMEWRNDPDTLKASFNQTPKVWESFWPEFQKEYFTIGVLPPLFVSKEGEWVAFLRFRPQVHPVDPARRCFELSIMVAPRWRGKGIAKAILKVLPQMLSQRGYDDILAEVMVDNPASLQAFLSAGFSKVDEVEKKGFKVVRLMFSLRPHQRKEKVFIIAEAGSNWRAGDREKDLKQAKALIDVAAEAGADAVKFQVFRADQVYVSNAGSSDYLESEEDISTIFDDLAMPYEMIPQLAKWCKEAGVQFMATPFSPEDFAAIDPHVSVHKIASYELCHLRLLELAARSGKHTIISTGAAGEEDIAWALNTFSENGGGEVTLLQCTAKYPAPQESMNLRAIEQLKNQFGVSSGLSDHSRDPVTAPVAAVALGATVIEKHFTLDNGLPGPDHAFALTPEELKAMVAAIRATEAMLGSGEKVPQAAEEELRTFARRAVQAIRPIIEGEELREGVNVAILRPGKQVPGIHPKFITDIEGKKALSDINAGAGIQFGDF